MALVVVVVAVVEAWRPLAVFVFVLVKLVVLLMDVGEVGCNAASRSDLLPADDLSDATAVVAAATRPIRLLAMPTVVTVCCPAVRFGDIALSTARGTGSVDASGYNGCSQALNTSHNQHECYPTRHKR